MIGSVLDMLARLKAVLPQGWFPDATPVLDGVLSGLAAAWSFLYGQLSYVRLQTRIATATDMWLDLVAQDFFGPRLQRRNAEPDGAFRLRIQQALQRERGTRAAVVATLTNLTGRAPAVFEPARVTDTGGWGVALGYGVVGGWGSLALPFQCFVTAYRPPASGIANVAGYGTGGPIQYASLSMTQGQVTDADIFGALADVLPAATIAWTCIAD